MSAAPITVHPVVEQQGSFFDVMEFFPTLTKELLEENRSWLEPTFTDPISVRLVLCVDPVHSHPGHTIDHHSVLVGQLGQDAVIAGDMINTTQ
jgi:glyoxylase-like metal-dependent hydrolase (beta-lactamase superfamily II)